MGTDQFIGQEIITITVPVKTIITALRALDECMADKHDHVRSVLSNADELQKHRNILQHALRGK